MPCLPPFPSTEQTPAFAHPTSVQKFRRMHAMVDDFSLTFFFSLFFILFLFLHLQPCHHDLLAHVFWAQASVVG